MAVDNIILLCVEHLTEPSGLFQIPLRPSLLGQRVGIDADNAIGKLVVGIRQKTSVFADDVDVDPAINQPTHQFKDMLLHPTPTRGRSKAGDHTHAKLATVHQEHHLPTLCA